MPATGRWRRFLPRLFLAFLAIGLLSCQQPAQVGEYVEGEVIVGFRVGTTESQIASLESTYALARQAYYRQTRTAHYRLPAGQTTVLAIQLLSAEPIVEYAEPNRLMKLNAGPSPRNG